MPKIPRIPRGQPEGQTQMKPSKTPDDELEAAKKELELLKDQVYFYEKRALETWVTRASLRLKEVSPKDKSNLFETPDKIGNKVTKFVPEEFKATLDDDIKGYRNGGIPENEIDDVQLNGSTVE